MRAVPLLITSLSLLAGCASDKGDVVEPDLGDAKADIASRVDDQGALALGAARAGAFTEDLQFFGFHLAVRAGAVVTIDNTHAGTAAQLDSTLFLYGPRTADGFGTAAIAFDDDAGYGRHARLTKIRIDAAGEYLVVLGTANGRGRGAYRVQAKCENGACAPLPTPAACDPQLSAGIQHCIAAQIADADLESDETTSYADALAICTDGEALGGIHDAVCNASSAPSYCGLAFEAFVTTQIPACIAELGQRTGLCGGYLDEALTLATTGMLFTSESDYPYDVVRWPGQGAPTAAKVRTLSGLPASAALETRSLATLFSWIARPVEPGMDPDELETVQRHRHLQRILEGNLTQTLVVRIGDIQIRVFLVGETSCGELAGLATTSIET